MERPLRRLIGDELGEDGLVESECFRSVEVLALLADDEAEAERCLGCTRQSSSVTLASGRDGAMEASSISVNFDVVIVYGVVDLDVYWWQWRFE